MSDKTLTVEQIAEQASKKCYKKHAHEITDELFGKKLDIKNESEFREHIQTILTDPKTLAVKADNGRNLYYNRDTNTFISQNNIRPDKCTCFRPEEREGYFLEKAKHECVDRRGIDQSKWKEEIKEGGYSALHLDAEKNKTTQLTREELLKELDAKRESFMGRLKGQSEKDKAPEKAKDKGDQDRDDR